MNNFTFLSHTNADKDIAKEIQTVLWRVTIRKVEVWFFSDSNADGGMTIGKVWNAELQERIEKSKVVICILTPNSIDKPWLFYEAGYAVGIKKEHILPVYIGFKGPQSVPFDNRQGIVISDLRSYKEFIARYLKIYDYELDEAFDTLLKGSIQKILLYDWSTLKVATPFWIDVADNLKRHIDKRMLEIWEKPNIDLSNSDLSSAQLNLHLDENKNSELVYFNVFRIDIGSVNQEYNMEVRFDDSFGRVMHNIYSLISTEVDPYTYLYEWIITDFDDNPVIIKNIADQIPSRFVIRPNEVYKVKKLSNPIVINQDV